jgi:hypothetical protein
MVPARALETKVDRNEDDLDEARRLVLSRTRALGLDLTTVSNGIGRSPGYIHQYIWRKIPQRLLQPEREKVAKMLGVDEKLLRGPEAPPEFVLPPGIETGLIYKEPIMPSLSNAGSASRITGRDVGSAESSLLRSRRFRGVVSLDTKIHLPQQRVEFALVSGSRQYPHRGSVENSKPPVA